MTWLRPRAPVRPEGAKQEECADTLAPGEDSAISSGQVERLIIPQREEPSTQPNARSASPYERAAASENAIKEILALHALLVDEVDAPELLPDDRLEPDARQDVHVAPPPDRPFDAAKEPKPRFRLWKPMIAIAPIIVAVAAAWWFLSGPAITAVLVTRGTVAEIVYATGSVEPETWSRLTPLVRGRIVERCRCEGAAVTAGQRLARLDDREGQAVLDDLRAQESFVLKEFERQAQLLARGATTLQAHQKAASDLERIRAQVSAQIERLKYYELFAPMDGIVLREDGEVGDMIDPGTILYRIGLQKPLWVVAEVNEEDIPRIAIGQKALLRTDAFAGKVLQGYVKQITPGGDSIAKTFRVRIGLPDDTPLRIGMTVEVNVVTREKPNALLVPANAVIDNSLLVIKDGQPVLREVSIGIRGTSNFEIVSGAEEGELVASPATANIKSMPHVRTTTIDAPTR